MAARLRSSPSPVGLPARARRSCTATARCATARRCSGYGGRKGCGCRLDGANVAESGNSTTPADRLVAERPDHVWGLDYQFDVTTTRRILKIMHVVDEHTRESLADVVGYAIDADATVDVLDTIAADRGTYPVSSTATTAPNWPLMPSRTGAVHRSRHRLHRPTITVAEPLGGVLRLPDARRTTDPGIVRHPATRPSACLRLARRVQPLQTPLRPRHAHPTEYAT
jgi:hypothetical protein